MLPSMAMPFPRWLAMAALFAKRSATDRGGPGSPGDDPSAATAAASGYDRVGVVRDGGELEWLSKSEYQALPLTERVRLLSSGGVRFFRGPLEIGPMEAMRGAP
jgi:hypothetical protein